MYVPNVESYMAIDCERPQQTERLNYNHRDDVLLPILAPAATLPLHLPARSSMGLHGQGHHRASYVAGPDDMGIRHDWRWGDL